MLVGTRRIISYRMRRVNRKVVSSVVTVERRTLNFVVSAVGILIIVTMRTDLEVIEQGFILVIEHANFIFLRRFKEVED